MLVAQVQQQVLVLALVALVAGVVAARGMAMPVMGAVVAVWAFMDKAPAALAAVHWHWGIRVDMAVVAVVMHRVLF